ncbi:MAG: gas vesicle protein GvpD P-loop domain-containing protein [Candidatus Helarchaeota archaeon]
MNSVTVPTEIMEALNKRFGFALLIKGNTGTGKTTLTLEILKNMKKPIYISTRVYPEFLYEQFPWIEPFLPHEQIYDATHVLFPGISSGRQKKYEAIECDDATNFIDELFERFQNIKTPTIVIDSWDAILGTNYRKSMPEDKFAHIITELVRKKNIKLVMVVESPSPSFLDYIVDGLVITHDVRVENRRVRILELIKMRSVRISQPYYTYTLEGARFRPFPDFTFQYPPILLRPDPIPDPNKKLISTGTPNLDTFLGGGFKRGSFILIEIAQGVTEATINYLIPSMVNHLNLGRGIVTILPEGYTASSLYIIQNNFVEKEVFLSQLISFERLQGLDEPDKEPVVKILGQNVKTTFQHLWENAKILKESGYAPILFFLGIDKLENMYEEREIIRELSDLRARIAKDKNDIVILFVHEGQNLLETLSYMADKHLRIRTLNRALVIYGISPQTEFHLFSNDLSKGYISFHLTPLV